MRENVHTCRMKIMKKEDKTLRVSLKKKIALYTRLLDS